MRKNAEEIPIPLVPPNQGQALQQTRVGLRNWLGEFNKKIDEYDMESLQWLNRAFANIASGLYAMRQRKVAALLADEPDTDIDQEAATDTLMDQEAQVDTQDGSSPDETALDQPPVQTQRASEMPLGQPLEQFKMALERIVETLPSVEGYKEQGLDLPPDVAQAFNEAKQKLEVALEKAKKNLEGPKVAALLDHLFKSANVLDATGLEPALQASEGIDAALEGFSAELGTMAGLVERLGKVADLFDSEGKVEAAATIDAIIKDAVELPKIPGRLETRKEKYDAEAHNRETMWERTKHEIAENRKQHHLEGHRDTTKSLSTRYSPELPGVSLYHISEGVYQDPTTRKIYDFNKGFSLPNGEKYPGGSVANQTPSFSQMTGSGRAFETRQDKNRRQAAVEVPMTKQAIKDDGLSGRQSYDDVEKESAKDEPLKRRTFERKKEKADDKDKGDK